MSRGRVVSLLAIACLVGGCTYGGGDDRSETAVRDSPVDATLRDDLLGRSRDYLQARARFLTVEPGSGVPTDVQMTAAFEAELDTDLLELARRREATGAYDTAQVQVEALEARIEDGRVFLDLSEHAIFTFTEPDAPPTHEYRMTHRFEFVRDSGEGWVLAADVTGCIRLAPSTVVDGVTGEAVTDCHDVPA